MCVIFRLQQVSSSSEACIPHGNNPSSTPAKHPRSNAHLLQQHTIPHTTVAVATTIIKDAMVTYRTLQSERPKHTKSFVNTLLWDVKVLSGRLPLTTVALRLSKLGSDEVLHPERVADAAPRERVTLAVTRAVELADWGGRRQGRRRLHQSHSTSHAVAALPSPTDRIHPPGLEDEEVVLLFAQFVAQAQCNAEAGHRGAPWTAGHQEDQPRAGVCEQSVPAKIS